MNYNTIYHAAEASSQMFFPNMGGVLDDYKWLAVPLQNGGLQIPGCS